MNDFKEMQCCEGNIRHFMHYCNSCNTPLGYKRNTSRGLDLCKSCLSTQVLSKPYSEEAKQKMRDNHYLKNGGTHPWKGKTRSDETKAKLSRAAINQLKNYSRTNFVYKGIMMRSSWEVKYAQYLDSIGISWEYEPEFVLSNGKIYIPDFKLDSGVIIEIKGFWRDDALDKWELFCKDYPELNKEVLMKQELRDLGLEV
jgi:hypothetical protein